MGDIAIDDTAFVGCAPACEFVCIGSKLFLCKHE